MQCPAKPVIFLSEIDYYVFFSGARIASCLANIELKLVLLVEIVLVVLCNVGN